MKKIFCMAALLSLLAAIPASAQPKATPGWSTKFQRAIQWQRVHALGYLVVGTADGLYGINPTDGKIVWQNKQFAGVPSQNYQEVEGTEFMTIAVQDGGNGRFPMQAVMEVVTGKVLFDSNAEQIGVLSMHVLPNAGRLLIIGARPGTLMASLFMYDINTGKQLWTNDELFKADQAASTGFLGKLQAMGQQIMSLQSLTSEPVELEDQTMLLTHPLYVMRINTADGSVVWKNSIATSTSAQVHFSPFKKGIVYVGTEEESETGSGFSSSSGDQADQKFYSNVYYAFDLATGAPIWKNPARENDGLNQVIMHEKGIIICPRSSQRPTINLINYETGETVWGKKGKGVKAQGSVVSYLFTEGGLLITTAFDNAWSGGAEEYYLNMLDPGTGTLRYEKSIKLKGDLVSSELLSKGLLFVTTREINILDTRTGELVWENSIESGGPRTGDKVRPFPTGSNGDKLYVFSAKDKGLFEVDKASATIRKVSSAEIEFAGKELPKAIDVADDGILIYSDQNILKVGKDGLLRYARYYPAPRQPALLRALILADAVRAAYIGVAASMYSAAFADAAQKTADPGAQAIGNELSHGMGQLGRAGFAYSARAMKTFNARFKASRNTPSFVMMMTTGEKKGNRLVQVSKANGEIMNSVDIRNDKEPEYDLDPIYNHLYYRPNDFEIVCYKL